MTLIVGKREATGDVGAYFAVLPDAIRAAAARVARQNGLPTDWLNDAVKGFMFVQPPSSSWLDIPGLRIHAPAPGYMFAMNAYAGRPEDVRDLLVLRELLGFRSAEDALAIVELYVPTRLLTARVRHVVEDLFDGGD